MEKKKWFPTGGKRQQTTFSKSKSTISTPPNIFLVRANFLKKKNMSESKFSELRKLLKKLAETYLPQSRNEMKLLDLFTWKEPGNFKKQVEHLRQLPPSRKASQLISRRRDKTRHAFIRYLSVAPQMKGMSFWKSLFPPENFPRKQVWERNSQETVVPQLSRGFKRMESLRTVNSDGALDQKSYGRLHRTVVDDVLEQKYYTEKSSRRDKTEDLEIPPPLKCRLACPLPPAEFEPKITKEYIPHYQPPTVKYSSIPTRLLPERKRRAAYDTRYSLDAQLQTQKRRKTTEKLPEIQTKNLKNYLNLQQVKSQIYRSPEEKDPTMKALLFQPDSLELSINNVTAPTKIFKDEIVVQVSYSGVCGTDLFILEGKLGCGSNPLILGHEISGTVYATGSDVTHVINGDKVAINPYTACCCCRYCSRGMFSSCINEGVKNSIGITKNGGWAEFLVVKKSQVFKVPDEMDLHEAALVQPLSRILGAMSKLKLQEGFVFVIQGLGLSGLLWASVLHSKGYKNVYVSDKNVHRIKNFQAMNLGYQIIAAEDFGKYVGDVVVETSGSPVFIEKSFSMLNPNGQLCFFGKPSPLTEIRCVPYEIVDKEISIVGQCGNDFSFSKAIDLARTMGHRYLDFDKLGVSVFNLEDYKLAFKMKKSGEVDKVMFRLSDQLPE